MELYNEETKEYDWNYLTVSPDEIEEFNTPFIRGALNLYRTFKACGIMPHGGGYLHEKPTVIEVYTMFDYLSHKMEGWIYENSKYL